MNKSNYYGDFCLQLAFSWRQVIPLIIVAFILGIYGIIGCALILIAYAGMNWEKLQSKDQHTRKIFSAFEQYFRDYHCP